MSPRARRSVYFNSWKDDFRDTFLYMLLFAIISQVAHCRLAVGCVNEWSELPGPQTMQIAHSWIEFAEHEPKYRLNITAKLWAIFLRNYSQQ